MKEELPAEEKEGIPATPAGGKKRSRSPSDSIQVEDEETPSKQPRTSAPELNCDSQQKLPRFPKEISGWDNPSELSDEMSAARQGRLHSPTKVKVQEIRQEIPRGLNSDRIKGGRASTATFKSCPTGTTQGRGHAKIPSKLV